MARADLDKDPRAVAAMFDGVARNYDRTNTLLSFGLDRLWRNRTRRMLAPRAGERILDLAAGTAVSTVELSRSGAWCLAADFSVGMLASGRDRHVPKVAADALRLPFADNSFHGVTVSFGLRNFADTKAALNEMRRVVKPGGRMVICEFSTPRNRAFRKLYFGYLPKALPMIANRVATNSEAYSYLAESIADWPDQPSLARLIEQTGWRAAGWRDLTGGIVALHRAVKPDSVDSNPNHRTSKEQD